MSSGTGHDHASAAADASNAQHSPSTISFAPGDYRPDIDKPETMADIRKAFQMRKQVLASMIARLERKTRSYPAYLDMLDVYEACVQVRIAEKGIIIGQLYGDPTKEEHDLDWVRTRRLRVEEKLDREEHDLLGLYNAENIISREQLAYEERAAAAYPQPLAAFITAHKYQHNEAQEVNAEGHTAAESAVLNQDSV